LRINSYFVIPLPGEMLMEIKRKTSRMDGFQYGSGPVREFFRRYLKTKCLKGHTWSNT